MVWDLLRTKKEKPAAGKTGYWRTFWRRRWDSNPRTLADQTISSRSRYDHFDTSPYLSQHQHLRKRGELMGRTMKNIQLKIPEKPCKIKGFRSGSYRMATTISSADPSTTWVHLRIPKQFTITGAGCQGESARRGPFPSRQRQAQRPARSKPVKNKQKHKIKSVKKEGKPSFFLTHF